MPATKPVRKSATSGTSSTSTSTWSSNTAAGGDNRRHTGQSTDSQMDSDESDAEPEPVAVAEQVPKEEKKKPKVERAKKNTRLLKQAKPNMSSTSSASSIMSMTIGEGLEPLVGIPSLSIMQEIEAVEVFTTWETNNHYNVMNSWAQRIYHATEKTSCCNRQMWGQNRPFVLNITDGMGDAVITVERSCNCCLCYCGGRIMGSNAEVRAAKSQKPLGKVIQNWSYTTPSFNIYDAQDRLALRLRGPCCAGCIKWCWTCDTTFKIYFAGSGFDDGQSSGTQAGILKKKFGIQELVQVNGEAADATNFELTFPRDLLPSLKACLLAAVFCIDFSYFENQGKSCACSGLKIMLILIIITLICVGIYLIVLKIQGKI